MAKRDAFVANGLRIETWRDFDGRVFICWKPDVSIYCRTRKEVLKFAAWPIKTPTGDALRSQLDSWEAMDAAKEKPANLEQDRALLKETGFDPLHHLDESDPQFQTRMIT